MSSSSLLHNHSADSAIQASKAGEKKYWCQLHGAAQALAIVEQAATHRGPMLVVCDNSQQALDLESQIGFFQPSLNVLHFPDHETLPYDQFSPHQDIISDRLACLYDLTRYDQFVMFVPVNTLMGRLPPANFLHRNSFSLAVGDTLELSDFRRELEQADYQHVETVYQHGEFTIRGGLIDVFPMGSDQALRIELFDIEVEQIKAFNVETQRSSHSLDSVAILPAREVLLNDATLEQFEDQWYQHFEHISLKEVDFYTDLKNHLSFAGIENYLPLFYQHTATLFDYLPEQTLIISTDGIEASCRQFWQDIQSRYQQYRVDKRRPLLLPDQLYLNEQELFTHLKSRPRVILTQQSHDNINKGFIPFNSFETAELDIDTRSSRPYHRLEQYLLDNSSKSILMCAESLGRKEVMLEILQSIAARVDRARQVIELDSWSDFVRLDRSQSQQAICVTVSDISQGLVLPELLLISESQLFGNRVQQRRRRQQQQDQNADAIIKNLTELKLGAAVVHIDHGIGRYLGLKIIEVDQLKEEFLTLKYADDALLYVPVACLHLISRYTGTDPDNAPLHKLGSDNWSKAKQKAAQKAHDVAAELLDIYARRAARQGFAHQAYSEAYRQFAQSFAFEETEDQAQAIQQVLADMASDQPMDRLVCGDVGFGKTEVAMRAAFTAVHSNQQVAVLVPTTLLAEQHYQSFKDRFANLAVNIEVLSRFKSAKQQQQVIQQLANGQIDILVGTHKLLQADVKFSRLGLIIIDEEHRFGVKQKESLKALRAEVDVLALTATPIPRTLNMSMAGIRDLSIIATPPAKRLSIKTFVHHKDDMLIKEAILREILRGGQVYFLHNEVKTIEATARELQALVPEARIGIGHGQMRERELEQVMSDFYHKRFNILLCTTIIETGIDVPNANTIIIERADKFGLAQLHQLRGRVGRSHHQAYAYMLTTTDKKLSKDAEKRLDAIIEAQDLGAGFMLATHDLEIRGAGELLGDDQSGQIHSIGFGLYMEMLERAVKAIQQGKTANLDQPLRTASEINLHISAIIPDDYIPDVHTRLIEYKSIAGLEHESDLRDKKVEMIDRFGLLPEALNNLFAVTAIKLKAEKIGIVKIDVGAEAGKFIFNAEPDIDPMQIVALVQSQPKIFSLDGSNTLKFKLSSDTVTQRIDLVEDVISSLSTGAKSA